MLTAEQKTRAISALSHPYGSVKFKATRAGVDYKITASVEPVRAMQYRIMVYVDGFVKGEWLMSESAPQTAFMRRRVKRLHSKKEVERVLKVFGKKEAERWAAAEFVFYAPDFASGTAAINHLLRAADSVELLS